MFLKIYSQNISYSSHWKDQSPKTKGRAQRERPKGIDYHTHTYILNRYIWISHLNWAAWE